MVDPYFEDERTTLYQGDACAVLRTLEPASVQTVVTSPPYWGLRDYGLPAAEWGGDMAGCPHEWGEQVYQRRSSDGGEAERKQETNVGAVGRDEPVRHAFCRLCGAWRGCLGLEPTPELYVEHIVAVFREVRRVLRDDGTVWLNLGDSYASQGGPEPAQTKWQVDGASNTQNAGRSRMPGALKPKDLVGIPWRVAFALQADGWWLRSAITWCKGSPMPESVRDRPTSATEMVFLLAKSERYFYDADAVRVPTSGAYKGSSFSNGKTAAHQLGRASELPREEAGGRNLWNWWLVNPQPYPEAHFATFPEELVKPCILAGTSERGQCPECGAPWEREVEKRYRSPIITTGTEEGRYEKGRNRNVTRMGDGVDIATLGWRPTCKHEGEPVPQVVLDPFSGSGTVGVVARKAGRKAVLIDLNPAYCDLAVERFRQAVLL